MSFSKAEAFKIVWHGPLSIFTSATVQKKELVILKLDFEKAFDKIEHEVIIKEWSTKGFLKNGFLGSGLFSPQGLLLSPLMVYQVRSFIAKGELDKGILCPLSYLFCLQIYYNQLLIRLRIGVS
jgi:hypothetical protein